MSSRDVITDATPPTGESPSPESLCHTVDSIGIGRGARLARIVTAMQEIIPWLRGSLPHGGSLSPNTAGDVAQNYASLLKATLEKAIMIEPKIEVPAELRDLAEKTIDQAEKAFGMFFDAAGKSMTSIPGAGSEISKQALSFTEQNMKAAFEHARKLLHATDLQEAMRIQSEFLRSQFTNAGEHMRQITGGVMSAAKDATKIKL